MKRVILYLGIAAISATILSCNKEKDFQETLPQDVQSVDNGASNLDPEKHLVSFGARHENDPESKVSVTIDTGVLAFEDGDAALVYVPSSGATGKYVYDLSSGLFKPETDGDAVSVGTDYAYVYYPFSEFAVAAGTVTFTMPSAVVEGSLEDLGNKLPLAGIIPAGDRGGAAPVATFKNLGSVLRLVFNSASAEGETITSMELSGEGVSITGSAAVTWSANTTAGEPQLAALDGGSSITIECATGRHLTSGAYQEFYFFLPPSGSFGNIRVKAVYGKSDGANDYAPSYTIARSSALALARNKIYKVQGSLAGFFGGGDGSAAYPYIISTAEQFKAIATLANADAEVDGNGYNSTAKRTFFGSAGVHYLQSANIDFESASLSSIGVYNATASAATPFEGEYDGAGKKLENFSVTGDKDASTGLFEYVKNATLKNIAVVSAAATGTNVTGILTGRCIGDTQISGCSLDGGTVTGRNSVGFIAHTTGNTTVDGCSVKDITVTTAASGADANNQGGVVGFAGGSSSVTSCTTSGTITFNGEASGAARGGIVGKLDSTGAVNGCTNGAAVSNALVGSTGGVAGQLVNGSIVSCVNTGAISGTSMVGGIAGFAGTTGTPTGTCFITSCRTSADVTGSANCVGGIAGKLQNGVVMSECYTEGAVKTSTYDVGGLVGLIQLNTNNALARVYVYDCLANMDVTTERASGACRTGGAVGNVTTTASQYVAIDNCGVLDVTITAGGNYVGGFVGWITGDGTNSNRARVRSCYTLVSSVPGSAQKGGFVGAVTNKAELRYDYFVAGDSSDLGDATTESYTQATASEIKTDATCTAFNGRNYNLTVGTGYTSAKGWAIPAGVDYPVPGALITLGAEYYK